MPGRKTDVKDSEWIAQLLQCGLLKASFVPDRPVRDLRDLTRQRVQLVRQKVQVANRIQKTLEDSNIKLASVASLSSSLMRQRSQRQLQILRVAAAGDAGSVCL